MVNSGIWMCDFLWETYWFKNFMRSSHFWYVLQNFLSDVLQQDAAQFLDCCLHFTLKIEIFLASLVQNDVINDVSKKFCIFFVGGSMLNISMRNIFYAKGSLMKRKYSRQDKKNGINISSNRAFNEKEPTKIFHPIIVIVNSWNMDRLVVLLWHNKKTVCCINRLCWLIR